MDWLNKALATCAEAEKSLRELMQGAVAAGEYRDLPALARLAEQLSQMASRLGDQPGASAQSAMELPADRATRPDRHPRRSKTRRSAARSDYPKFRRDGANLVKTGWSRSSRSEYEHRAPKRVVGALLKAIHEVEKKTPIFPADALFPLPDPLDGTETPAYQVYVALAWLRKEGLVRQHGREGYSLMVKNDLDKSLEERWNATPDGTAMRK